MMKVEILDQCSALKLTVSAVEPSGLPAIFSGCLIEVTSSNGKVALNRTEMKELIAALESCLSAYEKNLEKKRL